MDDNANEFLGAQDIVYKIDPVEKGANKGEIPTVGWDFLEAIPTAESQATSQVPAAQAANEKTLNPEQLNLQRRIFEAYMGSYREPDSILAKARTDASLTIYNLASQHSWSDSDLWSRIHAVENTANMQNPHYTDILRELREADEFATETDLRRKAKKVIVAEAMIEEPIVKNALAFERIKEAGQFFKDQLVYQQRVDERDQPAFLRCGRNSGLTVEAVADSFPDVTVSPATELSDFLTDGQLEALLVRDAEQLKGKLMALTQLSLEEGLPVGLAIGVLAGYPPSEFDSGIFSNETRNIVSQMPPQELQVLKQVLDKLGTGEGVWPYRTVPGAVIDVKRSSPSGSFRGIQARLIAPDADTYKYNPLYDEPYGWLKLLGAELLSSDDVPNLATPAVDTIR